MHRINSDGSANNRFVDGDPSTGTVGTVVDAAFMNSVQEELAGIVEGFGNTLSSANNAQIWNILQLLGIRPQNVTGNSYEVPSTWRGSTLLSIPPSDFAVTSYFRSTGVIVFVVPKWKSDSRIRSLSFTEIRRLKFLVEAPWLRSPPIRSLRGTRDFGSRFRQQSCCSLLDRRRNQFHRIDGDCFFQECHLYGIDLDGCRCEIGCVVQRSGWHDLRAPCSSQHDVRHYRHRNGDYHPVRFRQRRRCRLLGCRSGRRILRRTDAHCEEFGFRGKAFFSCSAVLDEFDVFDDRQDYLARYIPLPLGY